MMFRKYPNINHKLIVGKPGNYKDVTAVKLCYEGNLVNKKIFSNIKLGFRHQKISNKSIKFIIGDNWNPSICYIHDIGLIFHSREWKNEYNKDQRKTMVGNFRKRGIELIGTCHREMELEIELRQIIDWFIYPEFKNIGNKENMEDDIIILNWYDKPDQKEKNIKPKFTSYYKDPHIYAQMYNTLEEIEI